ncbi:hypothetical protein V5799_020212 [Amblyomma americanum]|uniref:Uncharacterized protein n=1 Tax=Amblyomma americanum TaxID=6943 RepID=A0AAQ4EUU4_AMBAM
MYVSCVRNDFEPEHAFADAGRALREALNLRSTSALYVPALIVKITALLRIDFFVRVRLEHAQGAHRYRVQVSGDEARSIDQQVLAHVDYTASVFDLRDTPLNLTPIHRDVLYAMSEAPSARSEFASEHRYVGQDNTAVGGQMMWRAALELLGLWHPRMTIFSDDPLVLQRLMKLFLVSWQDMSVFYVFHLSTWNLVRSSIGDRYTLAFPGPWQDSCSRELMQYSELWAAAAAYKKSSAATDLIIASFVDELLNHVQSEIDRLFKDVTLSVVNELSFMLPTQRFPEDWSAPNASDSYWANKLMVSEWLTGTVLPPSREDLQGTTPAQRIFLGVDVYADVRDDAGDMVFVNDALVGVDLAKQVWQFVLEEYVTRRRSVKATRFLSCLQNTIRHRSMDQAALFLAVRSVLKIRKTVDWDRLFLSVGSLKPLSNSQIFYIAYLNQGLCKKALQGLEAEDNVRAHADVLRHVAHFQRAFKCFPIAIESRYCFDTNAL